MRRIVAILIDLAPAWIWKSGNMRFVGAHTLHFCYGHEGRRTVEWDGHEIAAGRRTWPEEGRDENHAPVIRGMDPEFRRIDRLIHDGGDPEDVWCEVRDYIERNALKDSRWMEVATLTEDLIFLDADLYIDRIEAAAEASPAFRRAVVIAHIGGIAGPAVDRFLTLQERFG